MSKRSSLLASTRLSREGFQHIPEVASSPPRMRNPNDATIEIPLTTVTSQTGARRADTRLASGRDSSSPITPNEKTSMFTRYHGGKRRKPNPQDAGNRPGQDDEDTITKMGMFYNKVLDFSIMTRYFLYVLPLAVLIAIPIIIGAIAVQDASFSGVRIVWIFTWVEIVWISLWVSKLASKSLPYVFQFFCGIISSGVRKYALVIESLEIPLSLAGWALASLATFKPLMTNNPDQKRANSTTPTDWENIVGNILGAFMVAALIYLSEKLLVQLISIGYHRQQFDSKIKESKHHVFLLSLLYDASRALFKEYCAEFMEEDYLINDSIDMKMSKHGTGKTRSGSVTPLRLLQNVGRVGDKITAAFGNVAHEVTGMAVFNPTAAHSIVVEALEKNRSSEALAKRIWMSFVVEGKDSLYQDDITEVLGPERESDAIECFASLDRDGNGDISLDEMILQVCEIGRERKAIANSLSDVDSAINVLDNLLCIIVFIITVFVFVAFLNSSFATTLATAGTALLSLSFVFATTAQEVLGSCIFLFVKHPFDVGDRVDISDSQLVVERISLLFTVFKEIKTHKTTQVANIVLNNVWIENVSRSKAMREQLLMYISFDTSLEDVQLLRNEMQNFVLDKDNARDFQPEVDVEVTGIATMDKMELKVEIRHKSNWSNEAVRAARRSKFMCALVLALRKVPIYGPGGGGAALGSPDAPAYSVSVSDAQASASRDAFGIAKEAKRMIPTTPSTTAFRTPTPNTSTFGSITTNIPAATTLRNRSASVNKKPLSATAIAPLTETDAMNNLNMRHPASDPAHDWENGSMRATSPTDQRNVDIEEVRDVLRRQSTRGKRKMNDLPGLRSGGVAAGAGAPGPGIPTIAEPDTDNRLYHDYMASQSQGHIPSQSQNQSLKVSVGPRLPVRAPDPSGFGVSFDPFAPQQQQQQQQDMQQVPRYEDIPPQTPPKAPRPLLLASKKSSPPRSEDYWGAAASKDERAQEREQGRNNSLNNSFAVEKEGV